jgi:protoheme IX farnesyltransferase
VAVGAGAAGALNQWYEADIDALMKRTANRPLPSGRVDRGEALNFGVAFAVGSVAVMGVAVGWLPAFILAVSILFYVLVYTVALKRRTPQNIVIGGAAGAFPPMIGWAAATGDITLLPVLLFTIVFLWTPPHFWALALFVKTDYANAGVPMLPVVAGEETTRHHVLLYTLPMVASAIAPWSLGLLGSIYGVTAALLSLVFLLMAARVGLRTAQADDQMRPEKALFAFSILYLFILFGAVAADRMVLAL